MGLLLCLASCTSHDYDTGDGDYSYYTAEMAVLSLKETVVSQAELDDDRILELCSPLQSSVLRNNFKQSLMGDSCRLVLYYNKGKETASTVTSTELHGANPVLMPKIVLADTLTTPVKTDPLILNSSWKAKNEKYYNYNVSVKTGLTDGKTLPHTLGFVCDSITTDNSVQPSKAIVHLRLVHDQNSAPEFYSVEAFLSLSRAKIEALLNHYNITGVSAYSVSLSVNTYQGLKTVEL